MKISCKHCGTQFSCVNCYSNGRYKKKYQDKTIDLIKKKKQDFYLSTSNILNKKPYQKVYGTKPSSYTTDLLEVASYQAYENYKSTYTTLYKRYAKKNNDVLNTIGDLYSYPEEHKYE